MKAARASGNKAHTMSRLAQEADPAMNCSAGKPQQPASMRTALALLVFLITTLGVGAENYSIDWYKVAGGGGTSTGGIYSVSGTIGQHDAGGPSTGGNFSLTGGFWSLNAVQNPGAPTLRIALTSTNTAMVYWPSPSTGFNLQVNTDLTTASWAAPSETPQDNGIIKYIIVSPPTNKKFYRLSNP